LGENLVRREVTLGLPTTLLAQLPLIVQIAERILQCTQAIQVALLRRAGITAGSTFVS
jgi:hypothetical protein